MEDNLIDPYLTVEFENNDLIYGNKEALIQMRLRIKF